jgi:hypothetical protein
VALPPTCSPTCFALVCNRNSPGACRDCTVTRPPGTRSAGLADDAIRYAVAAGEMSLAARLIEQHFDAVHSLRGEAATVQRWLTRCPLTWSGPAPAAAGAGRPGLIP